MTTTVEIKGLRELREALTRKIPMELQAKVLQRALAAGTRLTVRDARSRAPEKTGVLKRAIFAGRDRKGSKPTFESRILGVISGKRYRNKGRDAFYWRFIEFGHRVATRATGRLKRLGASRDDNGGTRFVPARPFLRPAFESTKQRAAIAIKDQLAVEIEKAARKARF